MTIAGSVSCSLFAAVLCGAAIADPPRAPKPERRVPAEWEAHERTWMQWPRPIEYSYRAAFAEIVRNLQEFEPVDLVAHNASERTKAIDYLEAAGVPLNRVTFHLHPTDSAWMRDNGPVWVRSGKKLVVQDWGFDGWGGLVKRFANDDAMPPLIAQDVGVTSYDYNSRIVERGTLEFNGDGTLITSWTCLSSRNPGVAKETLEAELIDAFGLKKVIWIEGAPADDVTGGHIDGIARFIDATTVVVPKYVDEKDPDADLYWQATKTLRAAGLTVLRLEVPGTVRYRGVDMAANYVNWLVANGVVLLPGFGRADWDEAARARVADFFPGRDVRVVDTRELWFWGGAIHCVTNDQPSR